MIDTGQGIPEWATLVEKTLRDMGVTLSHVLLTHWHGDHTGGVSDLLRMYPHLSNAIYKNMPNRMQQPILDGQVFRVEGATVRAVHAPGHSEDHMCFMVEEDDAMCTGDNVLGHGTAAVEKLSSWMESLRVMQAHGCKIGYPAHGEVIQDLPAKIATELASKIRRENQVLQALAKLKGLESQGGKRSKGSVTVSQLVTEMHGERLDPEVRKMAVVPFMEEVLTKLVEGGKVAFEIRGGEKRWFGLKTAE